MSDSPSTLMGDIRQKIDLLATRLQEERRKNISLQAEKEALASELKATRQKLEKALLDAEYLSLSHHLASTPQSLADARILIGTLIRKVESAIDDIKKDPSDI